MTEVFRGDYILALLHRRHISISRAAEAVGVSREYLSSVVHNHTKQPSIKLVEKLSRYLGVSMDELYRGKALEGVAQIPVWGTVPGVEFGPREGEYIVVPLSQLASVQTDQLCAVEVLDDSLLGDKIHEGDYLVCDRMSSVIPNGSICIVRCSGLVIGRHVYIEKEMVRLRSSSSMDTYPGEDVDILAKAIISARFQQLP